ncbi:MAG: asparagine synthase (glutamine-hydrolyzing) [Gemmatimonadetes bacterium]|nr:asparagine synthase (glutamine-hydrolyzing) [Gemmatimonadota bacterium]
MCGFVGVFSAQRTSADDLGRDIRRMAEQLQHRGPDDEGLWTEPALGIALGFRRLAIIDISPAGHQPMVSPSGRYVIVFNGEIYNYVEIRRELTAASSVPFRGHSDTEVLLAAFDRWGIADTVAKCTGMFAMAVWDTRERRITLVRDRMGIKPLYVYAKDGLVLFGSELKALLAHPAFDRTLDLDALGQYFRHLYVPAPRSVFIHAHKVPAGTSMTVSDPGTALPGAVPFWSLTSVARQGWSDPAPDAQDVVDETERLLKEAVRLRMRSDVPVGALLSGGVDSSLVTALMGEEVPGAVRTFCIGFDEAEHDESAHAAAIARHLGTSHTEVHLTGEDALDVVPRVVSVFDEPFANPSHIPTLLVCEVARRDVTVALSGDGGDEVFAGYNRYLYGRRVISAAQHWPAFLRRGVASTGGRLSASQWDKAYGRVRAWLPGRGERLMGEKITKLMTLLRHDSPEAMYRSLMSAWQSPEDVMDEAHESPDAVGVALHESAGFDLLSKMQLADQLGYLPDDLLTKVDRVSMAVSLEVRVPLLDHNVVESSWRLPVMSKIREGETKWTLRQILYRRVPRSLVERPKTGFTVPLDQWLRGPLREWAEDLLTPDRLRQTGALNVETIRDQWAAFQRGNGAFALRLWTVLMFQAWRDRWA